MEKALIKHGNSLAIVIDKPILDLLQITADTKIELTTNGDSIMLTPVRDKKRQARLQAALQKINNQFGDDLKKLPEQKGDIDFLSLPDVSLAHADQIARYGGDPSVRDAGLLESAIAQPQATFEGTFLHEFPFDMAAAYLFHIVQNHPFVDGNRRSEAVAALLFLELNNIEIDAPAGSIYEQMIAVANGLAGKLELAAFFRNHAVTP